MPVLIGALVGRAFGLLLGRVVLSHAFLTVIVWYGLSAASFWLAHQNLGPEYGPYAAVLVPTALLAWTVWRPAESRVKLWLFDGFYVWTKLGVAWAVFVMLLRLLKDRGIVPVWIPHALPYAGVVLGCWLLQRAAMRWLRRSHVRAGDMGQIGE